MSPLFRFVPLAALITASAFLSGCGGGGSGPTKPTGVVYVPSGCDATTYSPNYIAQNSDAGDSNVVSFTYWRHFPITVYIDSSAPSTSRAATLAGFNEWQTALGRTLYTLTTNPTTADLLVSYLPNDQPADSSGLVTVGLTEIQLIPGGDNHIVTVAEQKGTSIGRNTMKLFVLNSNSTPDTTSDTDGTTQTIAAHEFGHVLGIGPHSLDENDLMYYLLHNNGTIAEPVTTRDLNTLKSVYCNTFPTGSALLRNGSAGETTVTPRTYTSPPLHRGK